MQYSSDESIGSQPYPVIRVNAVGCPYYNTYQRGIFIKLKREHKKDDSLQTMERKGAMRRREPILKTGVYESNKKTDGVYS